MHPNIQIYAQQKCTAVQITYIMQLTDKQIAAIRNMSATMAMDVMHECAERLGLVSVSEYCKLLGLKSRTVYKAVEDKKLPCLVISGHIFLSINN